MISRKFFLVGGVIAVFIILSLHFVFAVVSVGNPSNEIKKEYNPGESLSGWINVSLNAEPADSLVKSGSTGGIKLIDLLNMNQPGADYTCSPGDCKQGFNVTNGQSEKFVDMAFGKTKTIGLRIVGDKIDAINEINFYVDSNAPRSCVNQIEVDILADGVLDMINNNPSEELCLSTKSYGCFAKTGSSEDVVLGGDGAYCQSITLTQSPGFILGAWMKKNTNKEPAPKVTVELYDEFGVKVPNGECEINYTTITTSGSEVECEVPYVLKQTREHFICVSASGADSGLSLKKNSGSNANACGFFGNPNGYSGAPTASYQIYSSGKKFGEVGLFSVNKTSVKNEAGQGLDEMVMSYINTNFNGECSGGCIVPVKFTSNNNQQVNLFGLDLKYTVSGEGQKSEDKFYEVISESPKISSTGFVKLNIDGAEFNVGNLFRNGTKTVSIGTTTVFTEVINVRRAPTINFVLPTRVGAGNPTEFIINVDSQGENITSYGWFFGDGVNTTTTQQRIMHTYDSVGLYNMKVELNYGGQKSSEVFAIEVGSPKDILNVSIDKQIIKIGELKQQVAAMPAWYKVGVDDVVNLEDISASLEKIKRDYATASDDEGYTKIMKDLVKINLPNSIEISQSGSFPFLPDEGIVNLGYIGTAGLGEVETSESSAYKQGIYAWNFENVVSSLNYKQIAAYTEYEITPIMNVFEVSISKKQPFNYDYYFFVKNLEKMHFEGAPNTVDKTGFSYIRLNAEDAEKISFSTSENVDFRNLPAFITPEVSKLPVTFDPRLVCNYDGKCDPNESSNCGDCNSIWPLIFIIILILLIAIVAYVIMQQWYKKGYQSHLFKNSNQFYNIMTYVNDSKSKGMFDPQIKQNLRKVGWSNEQIDYALNKYSGRSTGMKEIPVEGFFGGFMSKLKLKKSPQQQSIIGKPQQMNQKPVIQQNSDIQQEKKGIGAFFSNLFKKKDKRNVIINNRKPIK